MKSNYLYGLLFTIFLFPAFAFAQNKLNHNPSSKTILLADSKQNISILIDYSDGCKISRLNIKGKNTLSASGVYTGFRNRRETFFSTNAKQVKVNEINGIITISNITYGDVRVGAYILPIQQRRNKPDRKRHFCQLCRYGNNKLETRCVFVEDTFAGKLRVSYNRITT